MQIGMVGLGRMGANIVRRLMTGGAKPPVVFDRDAETVERLSGEGAVPAASLQQLVSRLQRPRTIWIMLPAGEITETTIAELADLLDPDDTLIDGDNTLWQDDIRRAKALREKQIHYVDVGTSGGVWGLERGYCMMIGGEAEIVRRLDEIFAILAPGRGEVAATPNRDARDPRVEQGYLHAGPAGAGHFVKMIHNGIEYGLMQAYAEGFDILRNANLKMLPAAHRYDFDLADIAEVWRRGSVVSSWLLDLTATALARNESLDSYSGFVEDSGEGRWTIEAAIEEAVPAHVLTAALYARFRSRQRQTFGDRVLSAMRDGFGGHKEPQQHAEPVRQNAPDALKSVRE